MTQPNTVGPDPHHQYLEQLLRTDRTAWELFRMGYEAGLTHSIDHEKLSRIIIANQANQQEIKSLVKSTAGFIDVLAYRQNAKAKYAPRRQDG